MLLYKEEIVGASYRMKNKWTDYVGVLKLEDGVPTGKLQKDGTALLAAERCAAGFMRIKVDALRKWSAAYPDLSVNVKDGKKSTQFFSRIIVDGTIYCQDMAFSKRWRDIGGELWIDPNVSITHWGMVPHEGNLDAHLRALKRD
jgi:hypothetical protein